MKKLLKIMLIINTVILLPCVIVSIYNFFGIDTYDLYWNWFFGLSMLPVAFLGVFCLPHLACVSITLIYLVLFIKDARNNRINWLETALFTILSIICIIGLFSFYEVLMVAMSV